MSGPGTGLYRTEDHSYYWNELGPFSGVTGALGIIDKPALTGWAKRETAKAAIRNLDLLYPMIAAAGEDAVVKWLGTVPGYQRDKAAKLGSGVHALAELLAGGLEGIATPEEEPYVEAYRAFLRKYKPDFLAVEFGVISLTHGYGGTGDFMAYIGGLLYLVDVKTSSGVYKETALQLAAYGNADFVGKPGDPQAYELPRPDRYAVLHLRPDLYPVDGYKLLEYQVTPATFGAFLAALELSQFLKTSKPIGTEVPTSWVARR